MSVLVNGTTTKSRNFWAFMTFFFLVSTAQLVGSSFPNQEWNPGPLHWKHGVLTAGRPKNFLSFNQSFLSPSPMRHSPCPLWHYIQLITYRHSLVCPFPHGPTTVSNLSFEIQSKGCFWCASLIMSVFPLRWIAPLGPPAPTQPRLLGHEVMGLDAMILGF